MSHNRALYKALLAFVEEAAAYFQGQLEAGAEIQFELIDQGRSSAPLYCYRPLTDRFIVEHSDALSRLTSYPDALKQLAVLRGLPNYLRMRGRSAPSRDGRVCAEKALHVFLDANWCDGTEFSFDNGRFQAAFGELERTVYADSTLVTVLAPVEGLVLASDEVTLGDGLILARTATLHSIPGDMRCDDTATVAVVRQENELDDSLELAGKMLRRLQTALRLWDPNDPLIGPAAWTKTGDGSWIVVPLANGMRRHYSETHLTEDDERELIDHHALISRRMPVAGELAWALRRFELGCERATTLEALSDWLLAARALFSDTERGGYERVTDRFTAVRLAVAMKNNSEDDENPDQLPKAEVIRDIVREAIELEHGIIVGLVRFSQSLDDLIQKFGDHLRTILSATIRGEIDADLRAVADDATAVGSRAT